MDKEGALRQRIAERNRLLAIGRQGIERRCEIVPRLEHVRGKVAYAPPLGGMVKDEAKPAQCRDAANDFD
jgi:hypothetical protein